MTVRKITDADLEMVTVRSYSPQWEVRFEDRAVALITERYIASPPFVVRWYDADGNLDVEEFKFEDRGEVCDHLCKKLEETQTVGEGSVRVPSDGEPAPLDL